MFFAEIPEDQKEQCVAHLDSIIEKTIERGRERFKKVLTSACDDLFGYVTLWEESVRENTTDFDFMKAIRDDVFKQMLSSDPEMWSKYDVAKLFDAWQARCPEKLKAVLDANLLLKLEEANRAIEWERSLNRNRY